MSEAVKTTQNDVLLKIEEALNGLRFGSVEIVVHDGKVVQIERKEKVRLVPDAPRSQSTVQRRL